MEGTGKKVLAGLAAAVVVCLGAAAKWGDDIARSLRGAHTPPASGVAVGGDAILHVGSPAQVESQLHTLVDKVSHQINATPQAVREAGLSSACGVLYIGATEARLPTKNEWVKIEVDAVVDAAIDVPPDSPLWQNLEKLKEEVADAITKPVSLYDEQSVDDREAESIADELACAWV